MTDCCKKDKSHHDEERTEYKPIEKVSSKGCGCDTTDGTENVHAEETPQGLELRESGYCDCDDYDEDEITKILKDILCALDKIACNTKHLRRIGNT